MFDQKPEMLIWGNVDFYDEIEGHPLSKNDILAIGLSDAVMIQAYSPSKPRLLVLDEDRIILQSLSQFLRREGYDVRTSDNADDAAAILESHQIELLLADINMPGIKPAEFLRDIRKRFPHVVVIVITGYGSIEGAVEAAKIGAFNYLTQPIVD